MTAQGEWRYPFLEVDSKNIQLAHTKHNNFFFFAITSWILSATELFDDFMTQETNADAMKQALEFSGSSISLAKYFARHKKVFLDVAVEDIDTSTSVVQVPTKVSFATRKQATELVLTYICIFFADTNRRERLDYFLPCK